MSRMSDRPHRWRNGAAAATILTASVLLFPIVYLCLYGWILLLHYTIDNPSATQVVGVIYKYQTIISGVLAIISAIATILVLYIQINLQKFQFDEQIRRRGYATRAVLPLTLSALMKYSEESVKTLIQLEENWPSDGYSPMYVEDNTLKALPSFPLDVIQVLQNCVETQPLEYVDDFFNLLVCIQIFDTRQRLLKEKSESFCYNRSEIQELLLNSAELYVRY